MADGEVVYKITGDASGYNQTINQLQSTSTGAAKQIAAAFTAAFAAVSTAIGAAVKAGVSYNMEMESYATSFETMLGSATAAAEKIAELRRMAAETPFGMADLANATQVMLSFGISAEDASGYLKMLGDVSQGNSEKLGSLVLAFSQVQSAGKLTGQDLLQLINAGFNPLNEISKVTGETMEELRERMADGGVSAQELAAAFEAATSEGGLFYDAMQKQSETLSGMLSTLSDDWSNFLGTLTSGTTDVLKETGLPALQEALAELQESAESGELASSMAKFNEAIESAIVYIADLATDAIPKVIEGFAWLAENIDSIVPILETVVAGFIAFKTACAISDVVGGVSNAIGTLKTVFATLGGSATAASSTVTVFGTAMSGGAAAGAGILAAALAVVAVALVSYQKQVAEAEKRQDAYTRGMDKAKSAAEGLAGAAEASSQSFEAMRDGFDSAAAAAETLVGRLDELTGKSQATAAEQAEIIAIVDELNAMFPELGLAYDEVTNSLNMSTEAVTAFVEAARTQAELDSYISQYNDLLQQRNQIEAELANVQHERMNAVYELGLLESELRQAMEDGKMTFEEYEEAIFEASGKVDGLTEAEQILRDELDGVNGKISDTNSKIGEYSGLAADAAAAAEAMAAKTGVIGEAALDAAGDLGEANGTFIELANEVNETFAAMADDAKANLESLQEVTQNVFEKIKTDSAVSLQDMISNLQSNQALVAEWAQNMATLADRGINEGLLSVLREAGPQAAASVAELVSATDEEIAELNEVFASGGEVAMAALLGAFAPESMSATAAGVLAAAAAGAEAEANSGAFYNAGAAAAGNVAAGFTENTHQIDEAARAMWDNVGTIMEAGVSNAFIGALTGMGDDAATTIADVASRSVAEIQVLESEFKDKGTKAMLALLEALKAADAALAAGQIADDVSEAIDPLVDDFGETGGEAIDALTGAMDPAEPTEQGAAVVEGAADGAQGVVDSGVFEGVGADIAAGIAAGIDENTGVIADAARAAAEAAAAAAQDELEIHSPSRVGARIGRDFIRGIAVGEDDEDAHLTATRRAMREMIDIPFGAIRDTGTLSSYGGTPSIAAQFELTGSVEMDGYEVGRVVLRNFDDVAAQTLRGVNS